MDALRVRVSVVIPGRPLVSTTVMVMVVARLVLVVVVVVGTPPPPLLGSSPAADSMMVTKTVVVGRQAVAASAAVILSLLLLLIEMGGGVAIEPTETAEAERASTLVVAEKPAAEMAVEVWEVIADTSGVMEALTIEGVEEIDTITATEVLEVEKGGVLGAP